MQLVTLPSARELCSLGSRAPRWRPGLRPETGPALHNEIFASGREGSGAAAALALALDGLRHTAAAQDESKALLWVQDAASARLTGKPYRHGLPRSLRRRVIHVLAQAPQDALFALEEGLRCRDLACVIGEVAGNPQALDFTASRRLSLAAERHGVPLFLVRLDARRDLSSARMRWEVGPAASPPPRWNPRAPGTPSWHAELFRARMHPPGEWILRDDGQVLAAERPHAGSDPEQQRSGSPDHGDLAGAAGGRSLAAG